MIKKHRRTHPMWMRRTSRIYLVKTLNKNKEAMLQEFLNQYKKAINYTIVRYWSTKDVDNHLSPKSMTDTIRNRFEMTARLAQCVAKQAKEIVLSQQKKPRRKRRMPRLKNAVANMDGRFFKMEEFEGYFDMCLKLGSGVPKLIVPFNWTVHTNKFRNGGWILNKSIRIKEIYNCHHPNVERYMGCTVENCPMTKDDKDDDEPNLAGPQMSG